MTPYELFIREAIKFGQDPKLGNITDLLLPLASVAATAKNQSSAEIAEALAGTLDNLIGTDENAIISGSGHPTALIKIDIPILTPEQEEALLETVSDMAIKLAKDKIMAKLAEMEAEAATADAPPATEPPATE